MRPLPVRRFGELIKIMVCTYNDPQCKNQGYCNCRRDDTAEAAVGLGGLLLMLVVGIVASFLYPAIKILRSEIEYEANGATKFAGSSWLFLSPVFGFLSNVLYQIVFAAGACAAGGLQSKIITGTVYTLGVFGIYALSISLAVISFAFKNRQVIKSFFAEPETRTSGKTLMMIGAGVMVLLVGFAGLGIVAAATNGYFSRRAEVNAETERQEKLISSDAANHDAYVGKYKLITREDDTIFQVVKSSDGKGLRLSRLDGKNNGKNSGITGENACLLTPQLEGNSVFYAVTECTVDGKPSPLAKVYFEIRKTRTVMGFVYNVRASGDDLEKIE